MLLWQTFLAGLRERGWNEGVNIRIEYRSVEGNVKLPRFHRHSIKGLGLPVPGAARRPTD